MTPALPSPISRRPPSFLLVFALAYAGAVIAYLPLLSLLLPIKIGEAAGEAQVGLLTASVVFGALAASVSNIVFGALSDRALARGHGRRPWLAGGAAMVAGSYAVLIWAASPLAIVLAVTLFQVAVNALLAPLLAIMADEVPDEQKGVTAGLLSLGAPTAAGLGALLVGVGSLGEAARLAIVPLATTVCVLPLLATRATALPPPMSRAVAPMRRTALAIAWTARLLVQVAGCVVSLYLLYYFEDIVPAEPPAMLAASIGKLLTVAGLLPLPIAVAVGRLSDRTGARRPALFLAAVVAAFGLLGLAAADSWTFGAIAFGFYTVGSAVFLTLHAGFAMQLLPDPRHRGRDLGLLNLTNTLPSLLGPLLAWSLAKPHDFRPVMLALAGLTLAGGLTVLAVRPRS